MCVAFSALSSSAFPAPPPLAAARSLCPVVPLVVFPLPPLRCLCGFWAVCASSDPFFALCFASPPRSLSWPLVHLSIDVAGALGSYSGTNEWRIV